MGGTSSNDLAFSCNCGSVQGHLDASAAKSGNHVVCYCADCRAAELYLGQPDPAPGPVDILQTTPGVIHFTQGQQHLGLFRLGPKGLFRWYATCCNAPMFNTLQSPKLAFAGVAAARLTTPERLGPVISEGFIPQPDGKRKHKNVGRSAFALFSCMIAARLSGRWRNTPFFDVETGEPVRPATILTKEERKKLYPKV